MAYNNLAMLKLLYVNNVKYFAAGLSPDGALAYLASRGWVTVERTSDGVVLERAPLGPVGRTLVAADGSTLYSFEYVYAPGGTSGVNVAAMTLR